MKRIDDEGNTKHVAGMKKYFTKNQQRKR